MKPYVTFFFFFFLALPAAGSQAEIFIRKDGAAAAPQQEAPPLSSQPAPAQPPAPQPAPDIHDFVRRYEQNCLNKQHPVLNGDALRKLCNCSSAKIMETMRVEDIQAMTTDTPEGQHQRDRMLLSVYVPCMEYPVQALILHSCLNNPDVAGKVPNYQQICACAAENTADYVRREAPQVVAESLRNNPGGAIDPLQALVGSPAYEEQTRQILMTCLQRGVLAPAP